jgi:hypothetical protein
MVAFAAMFSALGLGLRTVLPDHHFDAESRDTVKVGIGLVATIAALVLGLVTASAKSSYDAMDSAVRNTSVDILTLDRVLARYGSETGEIRNDLQSAVGTRIDQIWPQGSSKPAGMDPVSSGSGLRAEGIVDSIRALKPQDDSQRTLQSHALELAETFLRTRWLALAGTETAVPGPFLVIIVFWLTIIFVSLGLYAPRNATVNMILFVCALSIGGALFLILEMNGPFDGMIRVSAGPLRYGHAN